MNILRCNQKCMFCKDHGIDFRFVHGIRVIYMPRNFGDFHFTAHWTEKGRFPTLLPSSKTKLSVYVWQKISKTVGIIRFRVVVYHFYSFVFTDVSNFHDPWTISKFIMWPFKNINWWSLVNVLVEHQNIPASLLWSFFFENPIQSRFIIYAIQVFFSLSVSQF